MHKLLIESRCSILFTEVNFHPEECDLARSGGGTSRTWNNLGVAFFVEGRQRDAASAFAEALKHDIVHETVIFSSHRSIDATPV